METSSIQSTTRITPSAQDLGDIEFWMRLVPEFSINETPFLVDQADYRFTDVQAERLSRQIRTEGYFQSEPVLPAHEHERLATAIARINQARALPVFIAIFDEFWRLLHGLRNTFDPILGKSYRLSPDFWAWHISPNSSGRGWGFHRDAEITRPLDANSLISEDGRPRLCTIWIPLTDATTHNSCIYVLPFPHDPAIQSFLRKENMAAIQQQGQLTNWTDIRALPAQAGSVLGWNPYIVHWGSQSTDWATHARVSIGIYYEGADAPAVGRPYNAAGQRYIKLHDANFPITFEERLAIIANILETYINSGQMANEPNFSPSVIEFCQRWKRQKI
jgi:hypothetical protein